MSSLRIGSSAIAQLMARRRISVPHPLAMLMIPRRRCIALMPSFQERGSAQQQCSFSSQRKNRKTPSHKERARSNQIETRGGKNDQLVSTSISVAGKGKGTAVSSNATNTVLLFLYKSQTHSCLPGKVLLWLWCLRWRQWR